MKPSIALDMRSLRTGIGRYSETMIHGLRRALPEVELCGITHAKNCERLAPYVDRVMVCNAGMYDPRAQIEIPWLARGSSLLHCQHYNIPLLYVGQLVATIHDITHLIEPAFAQRASSRLIAKPLLWSAVRKAKRVITVSEYSRHRLVERLGCDPERIVVIPNSLDPMFKAQDKELARAEVRAHLGIEREYLLFVGSLKPHKNLSLLLQALALLRRNHSLLPQLLLIGSDAVFGPQLQREAEELGLGQEVVWRDNVRDSALPSAYAAATALVLPSREEGFGLPIIEAMACGTPVICSNAASLPEVAGGAALMFDVASAESCCEMIERLLDSSTLAADLRARGFARAHFFADLDTAAAHADVFTSVLRLGRSKEFE